MIDKVDNIWRPIEDIYWNADYLAKGQAGKILCKRLQQIMRRNCKKGWNVGVRVMKEEVRMEVLTGRSKFLILVNRELRLRSCIDDGNVIADDIGFYHTETILAIQDTLVGFLNATACRLDTIYNFKTVKPEEAAK